ncbi:MAG: hypothetical protein IPO18_14400 [bacterium]|nr:hypothetical protein [bacterium]
MLARHDNVDAAGGEPCGRGGIEAFAGHRTTAGCEKRRRRVPWGADDSQGFAYGRRGSAPGR